MKNINLTMVSAAVLLFGLGQGKAADITCTPTPDCADLGYKQSEADCNGKAAVKCPFDTSRLYCKDTPVIEGCGVGSYLYSDKSCSAKLDTSRTLVGIVFDPVKKLAMQANYYGYSFPYFYYVDIDGFSFNYDGIEFCSPAAALNDCATNGKENTRQIFKNRVYPYYWNYSGYYAYNSFLECIRKVRCSVLIVETAPQTSKISKSVDCLIPYYNSGNCDNSISDSLWYGANHWFIPSLQELDAIYKNKEALIKADERMSDYLSTGSYIIGSSTVNDHEKILGYNFTTGTVVAIPQSSSSSVRSIPVINYGDTSKVLQCSTGYTIYANRYLNEQYRNYCIETDENGCLTTGKVPSCEYLGVANTSGSYASGYQLAFGTDYDDLQARAETLPESDYGYFICRHCTKRLYRLFDNRSMRLSDTKVTILRKKSSK